MFYELKNMEIKKIRLKIKSFSSVFSYIYKKKYNFGILVNIIRELKKFVKNCNILVYVENEEKKRV